MAKKNEAVGTAMVVKQDSSVDSFITQAIQSNVSVETMERLLAMRESLKAEQARSAFIAALSAFQKDLPIIKKTKKVLNKDGRTVRYMFAPIDSIVSQIKDPLQKHGLSYSWDSNPTQEKGFLSVICTVRHILGHSVTSEFKVPVDQEGYMTAPQKVASALTFAKRYSLCNALGISTGDEDTDATDVKKESDAKSIRSQIVLRLRSLGMVANTPEQCRTAVMGLTKLELVEENFEEITDRLEILINERNEDSQIQ